MASTRPSFPPECFTSAWTSYTATDRYDDDATTSTVTVAVGCPRPFRIFEEPTRISGSLVMGEHVTDVPDAPECCGPFTKPDDPELDYLEATNVLCPESYAIVDTKVKDGMTGGNCVATVDNFVTHAVQADSDAYKSDPANDGSLPTITQAPALHIVWDQEVISEKYGGEEVAPELSSNPDANPDAESDNDDSSGPNLPAIIAPSVIGGLILFAVIAFLVWFVLRKQRQRLAAQPAKPPDPQYPAPMPQGQPQQPQMQQYSMPGAPVMTDSETPVPVPHELPQQPQQSPQPQQPQLQHYPMPGTPVTMESGATSAPSPAFHHESTAAPALTTAPQGVWAPQAPVQSVQGAPGDGATSGGNVPTLVLDSQSGPVGPASVSRAGMVPVPAQDQQQPQSYDNVPIPPRY